MFIQKREFHCANVSRVISSKNQFKNILRHGIRIDLVIVLLYSIDLYVCDAQCVCVCVCGCKYFKSWKAMHMQFYRTLHK